MKSFLIGSLPHKNVEEALEYTFSFDIPTLPTLPNIDPNEFMVDQALCELDGFEYIRHGLRDKNTVYNSSLRFAAREFFFKRAGNKEYKWQASGPLTLMSSLDHHPQTKNILDLYFDKLVKTQAEFNRLSKGKTFFFLDEPVLAFSEESMGLLEKFLCRLKENSAFKDIVFGLHACSKARAEALRNLSFDLFALDSSLYDKSEWKQLQAELGKRLIFIPVTSKGESTGHPRGQEAFASSSCGLALTSLERLGAVHKNLNF
ncbi:MAG: hypothetical protein WD025_01555 [Bacteriovoracaceae bacterium]